VANFAKNLTILLAIPAACYCGYTLWSIHNRPFNSQNGEWTLLEPGDAPTLEADSVYVDSTGMAVPYRQRPFKPDRMDP
jgi:hypothetical protein